MQLAWKVEAGSNVKLQDYDPDYVDEHTDPALGRAELDNLARNWVSYRSCWQHSTIIACSLCCRDGYQWQG